MRSCVLVEWEGSAVCMSISCMPARVSLPSPSTRKTGRIRKPTRSCACEDKQLKNTRQDSPSICSVVSFSLSSSFSPVSRCQTAPPVRPLPPDLTFPISGYKVLNSRNPLLGRRQGQAEQRQGAPTHPNTEVQLFSTWKFCSG